MLGMKHIISPGGWYPSNCHDASIWNLFSQITLACFPVSLRKTFNQSAFNLRVISEGWKLFYFLKDSTQALPAIPVHLKKNSLLWNEVDILPIHSHFHWYRTNQLQQGGAWCKQLVHPRPILITMNIASELFITPWIPHVFTARLKTVIHWRAYPTASHYRCALLTLLWLSVCSMSDDSSLLVTCLSNGAAPGNQELDPKDPEQFFVSKRKKEK